MRIAYQIATWITINSLYYQKGELIKKKKLAFICQKGLETFIEPIVKEFEKFASV